jgi:hypothetical protein
VDSPLPSTTLMFAATLKRAVADASMRPGMNVFRASDAQPRWRDSQRARALANHAAHLSGVWDSTPHDQRLAMHAGFLSGGVIVVEVLLGTSPSRSFDSRVAQRVRWSQVIHEKTEAI